MPLDDGCRFDQHHGVENLRPDPVKPNPEQPVGGEEPRPARALPAQDGHLMSQGDELKFQRGAAAHPEQEQRTEGGPKVRARAERGPARRSRANPTVSALFPSQTSIVLAGFLLGLTLNPPRAASRGRQARPAPCRSRRAARRLASASVRAIAASSRPGAPDSTWCWRAGCRR